MVASLAPGSKTLQEQAEFATVDSTLRALRASLLVTDLQNRIKGQQNTGTVVPEPLNPFKVLETLPANYAGEAAMAAMVNVKPGTWVFDKDCICIGYRPLNPLSLKPVQEPSALWFRLTGTGGMWQLTALQTYEWQGKPVR